MYGVALHLLLDKDQKRLAAELGYFRNLALAEEIPEEDIVKDTDYKKLAWKKAEHRGHKEHIILDKV